ncbi:hypothetical protein PCK1_002792 [Pneumocystis canis]|nr:hypothetical protein PCK1_002792 [Pneumocystis canis]
MQKLRPEVKWAQRSSDSDISKNVLYITLVAPNIVDPKIDLTEKTLKFEGFTKDSGKHYELDLEFYEDIDAENFEKDHTDRSICLTLVLDRYSFLGLDKLGVLDLSGSKFSRIPLMPKCLFQLNLSHLLGTDISFSAFPTFQYLWRLNLSYSPGLYSNVVIALSNSSGCNLKELILDHCPRIDKYCIINIAISCKFIEKLSLSGNSWVDDSLLEIIARELKELKDVNLSNCYSISGFGVIGLVKMHSSLIMHIGLNGCYNVSLDSVTWMRQLGIKIDYKFEMNSSNKL